MNAKKANLMAEINRQIMAMDKRDESICNLLYIEIEYMVNKGKNELSATITSPHDPKYVCERLIKDGYDVKFSMGTGLLNDEYRYDIRW